MIETTKYSLWVVQICAKQIQVVDGRHLERSKNREISCNGMTVAWDFTEGGRKGGCLPPFLPPSLPFPSLPFEVGPLNSAKGLGECCKLPQWGMGEKSNLVHFSLKIWYLVATILIIFLRISSIKWPNSCILNTRTFKSKSGPNFLWLSMSCSHEYMHLVAGSPGVWLQTL